MTAPSRTEARAGLLLDALGVGIPACRHGAPEGADCPDCAREAAEDAVAWTDHDQFRADSCPAAPRPPAPEYDRAWPDETREMREAREARMAAQAARVAREAREAARATAEDEEEARLAALLAEAEPGWREDERRWRDLDEAREASEHAARWTEAPDDEEGW